MPQRTCTVPGCDKKHLARGHCGTHYNQRMMTKEQRHPKVAMPCAVCGGTITRGPDRRRRPACSTRCRTLLQWGAVAGGGYDWATSAAYRAHQAGATRIDTVYREDVLSRDGWRCYICGVDTSEVADPFDPRSATIDHVIPLSQGGEHTMANVRCCCLHCNSAKQAREVESVA